MSLWLRALHLLFGILWAGGAVYSFVVVRRMFHDEEGRDAFFARSPHGPFMGIAATLTFAFGLATMLQGSYDMEALGGGFFLFHGALGMATLALVLGWTVHLPTDIRLRGLATRRLEAGLEDEDEAHYGRLLRREHTMTHVSAGLIGLAALGMVFFRAFA